MEKKLYTFKFDGWAPEAAFCCRAISYAEAFSIFLRAVECYGWVNGIRQSRIVCEVVPDPKPDDVLSAAYHAVILGE